MGPLDIGVKSDVTAKNLEETPFNTSQKLLKKEDGTWRLEVDIQDSRMLDGWDGHVEERCSDHAQSKGIFRKRNR